MSRLVKMQIISDHGVSTLKWDIYSTTPTPKEKLKHCEKGAKILLELEDQDTRWYIASFKHDTKTTFIKSQ